MTAELTQTLAEHGISSDNAGMSTDEALVYRLLDSVAADGGLTEDAKKEVRSGRWCGAPAGAALLFECILVVEQWTRSIRRVACDVLCCGSSNFCWSRREYQAHDVPSFQKHKRKQNYLDMSSCLLPVFRTNNRINSALSACFFLVRLCTHISHIKFHSNSYHISKFIRRWPPSSRRTKTPTTSSRIASSVPST